jgi:hypothetical protein
MIPWTASKEKRHSIAIQVFGRSSLGLRVRALTEAASSVRKRTLWGPRGVACLTNKNEERENALLENALLLD